MLVGGLKRLVVAGWVLLLLLLLLMIVELNKLDCCWVNWLLLLLLLLLLLEMVNWEMIPPAPSTWVAFAELGNSELFWVELNKGDGWIKLGLWFAFEFAIGWVDWLCCAFWLNNEDVELAFWLRGWLNNPWLCTCPCWVWLKIFDWGNKLPIKLLT